MKKVIYKATVYYKYKFYYLRPDRMFDQYTVDLTNGDGLMRSADDIRNDIGSHCAKSFNRCWNNIDVLHEICEPVTRKPANEHVLGKKIKILEWVSMDVWAIITKEEINQSNNKGIKNHVRINHVRNRNSWQSCCK